MSSMGIYINMASEHKRDARFKDVTPFRYEIRLHPGRQRDIQVDGHDELIPAYRIAKLVEWNKGEATKNATGIESGGHVSTTDLTVYFRRRK